MGATMAPGAGAFATGTHAARLAGGHVAGRLWKETDTGLIYRDDGAVWSIWKGDGSIQKTADQALTPSSTALQDDNHLFFPVETGEEWHVEVDLRLQAASANSDWQFGWSVPTGAVFNWGAWVLASLAGLGGWVALDVSGTPVRARAANETVLLASLNLTGNNVQLVRLSGFLFGSTAPGTVKLREAQGTAQAETDTVMRRSLMRMRRSA